MADLNALREAMADLEEDTVNSILNLIMAEGGGQAQEAVRACQEGMTEVGNRFETGEYFIGDLIFAGEILTNGLDIVKPVATNDGGDKIGKVILCTVRGDLHDIGKNIVKAIYEASGFEIVDLGVDTPVETIVAAAIDQEISVIALSGVLTLAIDSMKETVDGFIEAGIRDKVKILIGGIPVSEKACEIVGADAWAYNPQKSVEICTNWLKSA
jgi:methanogenic corrinoid protein MtbC1